MNLTRIDDNYCEAVRRTFATGVSIIDAATMLNTHPGALSRWIAVGRKLMDQEEVPDHEQIFLDIYLAMRAGENDFVEFAISTIKAAAAKDWKAAAWLLERKVPDVYGKNRRQIEYSGDVEVIIKRATPELDSDE